ncbi:hypothetical protein BDZ85DRAFT_252011 [Elsinoe ampelina]|uniref:Uncharacterized protein n=1 Tax=Elsinoe ampelina TaxID=302913 RepID=A0A6A6G4Q2_9PEZI|nr:hypothetical protein BDZ85DRAFT_252011 [Elsinoe ampelina]
MATSTTKPSPFTPKARKVVFGFLIFHLFLCLVCFGIRLGYEPRSKTPTTTTGDPAWLEYQERRRKVDDRRFVLSMVNTAIEALLGAALVFLVVQFKRQRREVGSLLIFFIVESVYWIAAFSTGLALDSSPNATLGGAIMGLSLVWVAYLGFMYHKQKKSDPITTPAADQANVSTTTTTTTNASAFKPRVRKVVFWLMIAYTVLCLACWGLRLGFEPRRFDTQVSQGEWATYQERRRKWENQRFILSMVNTGVEAILTAALVTFIVQFKKQKRDVGSLLVLFIIESLYWITAFGLGMGLGSSPNATLGGAVMGLSIIWVIYLGVMYHQQQKQSSLPESERQASTDKPISPVSPFTRQSHFVVAWLLVAFAATTLACWAARFGVEPIRYQHPYQGSTPRYSYRYESHVRFLENRQWRLFVVNTSIEPVFMIILAVFIVRFKKEKCMAGTLLLVLIAETVYWAISFGIGLHVGGIVNVTLGGAVMGLCVVWDTYLLVMWRRQGKMLKEEIELGRSNVLDRSGGRRGSTESAVV